MTCSCKSEMQASLAFMRTYGVVPPGLAQLTCLPSAEALGLIVSSSGLGPWFTSDRDGVSSWGPGRCCMARTGPAFSSSRLRACSALRRRDRECWRSSLNASRLDRVLASCLHVDQSEGGTLSLFCGLDRYDTLVIFGAYFEFDFVACVIALALEFVRIL
jgi:hypothetical protein